MNVDYVEIENMQKIYVGKSKLFQENVVSELWKMFPDSSGD